MSRRTRQTLQVGDDRERKWDGGIGQFLPLGLFSKGQTEGEAHIKKVKERFRVQENITGTNLPEHSKGELVKLSSH